MTEDRGNGPGRRARRLLRRVREADTRRGKRRDLQSRRAGEAQRSIAEALLSERSGGDAEIPRDEWGVPLDGRHVRSSLMVEGARPLRRMLSGPRRSDFTRPFRRKRDWIFLGVAVLMLPVLLYYLASDRLTAWSDPPVPIEGEERAAGLLWEASPKDVFEFDETAAERDFPSRFERTGAVWAVGETVVRADRAGVTSYAAADGEVLWRTDPGGEGLCTAAGDPAGDGVGVLVVEHEGGDGTDGRGCDTVLGIDLSTGERLWEKEVPELAGVRGDDVEMHVRAWSAGGQAVASWGPLLAGFDAAGGEVLWTATELPGPDGRCPTGSHEILPRGDGEAAVLGFCGSGGDRPFTGVLDTATGEMSGQLALPAGEDGAELDVLRLVAADPVVVYGSPGSGLFGDSRQSDELLVAADDGWNRIAAWGEAGVGAEKREWGLDHRNGRFAVAGGVLYAETSDRRDENRVAAFDLDGGELLWDRRVEDHVVRIAGVDGDRLLAVARTGTDTRTGDDEHEDPLRTRVLALPASGEGPAELVADGLPDIPQLDNSPVRLYEFDGAHVVGPFPGPGGDPGSPLFAAG